MSVLAFIPTHNYGQKFAISGEVDENCVLLGYYAASSGNSLPTFRDNISVSSSRMKNQKIRKRRRKKERKKRNLENGTNTLFRNVEKELPLLAA